MVRNDNGKGINYASLSIFKAPCQNNFLISAKGYSKEQTIKSLKKTAEQ